MYMYMYRYAVCSSQRLFIQDLYEYSRNDNPTRGVFERCIAALEGAKHGTCNSQMGDLSVK